MNEIVRSFGTSSADPAEIGYPPSLPIEIALKTAPLPEIQKAYGFSDEAWQELRYDPIFLRDLKEAVELVKEEGMSFKLKAQLQADELLKSSWRLIHGPKEDVPASVKADLIKATMRWAGYEQKSAADALQGGTALNIQINLGS